MELYQVRYFLALCETLNFTKAAELSNVSQPSLTRAIKLLEEELGGALFIRERKHTHLTKLGAAVLPHLEQIQFHVSETTRRAESYNSMESAQLKIALTNTQATAGMIDFIQAFQSQHDGVQLHLVEACKGEWRELLLSGDCDAVLSASPEKEPDEFNAIPLMQEKLSVGFARHHRFAKLNAVKLEDLAGEPYLACDACEYASHIDRLLDDKNVEVGRKLRSEREDWVTAMAAAGLGFCLLPQHAFTNLDLLTRPLIEPEVERVVRLLTAPGRPYSSALNAFVQMAKAMVRTNNGRSKNPASTDKPPQSTKVTIS